MPVTLSAIPLDEHHSVAPLTTASRPWPPIVITALSDQLADLHNNRGRTFAYQEASCSSLQAAVKAWPPRSYTCSFCRREFSSAQGLGGHMNVHRRDRARLCRPSLPSSANIKDHNGAQQHLPPLTSHEPPASSDYPPSPLISLMYPVSRSSDSLSCKLIFPTVPLLVTTSPFVSNSSSPALVSNPSTHISCPNDSTTSRSWRTLSPAVQAPQPPPPSPSLAASSPLIPLVGQANSAVDCLPSSHLDMKRCRPSSHHSTILLKSYSTRKKSIASFGFQPYRSFSFKNLADSVHTLSGSDVHEKGTIGLDLELRLGQSS